MTVTDGNYAFCAYKLGSKKEGDRKLLTLKLIGQTDTLHTSSRDL